MNELKEITSLATIQSEVEEKVNKIKNLAITPENAKRNEDLRKDNNAYIKDIKNSLNKAKEEYLKPFSEQEEKVLSVIEPLEIANKELSANILDSKKIAFKNYIKSEFELLAREDANGELPEFEDIYEPTWYGLTKIQARENLVAKLKKFAKRANKVKALILVNCTEEDYEELQHYIYTSRINAEFNKMED